MTCNINSVIGQLDYVISNNCDPHSTKVLDDAKDLLCYMEDMLGVLVRVVDTYDRMDIIPHEEALDAAATFLKELQKLGA